MLRAIKVACVVGPILTMINQYDVLLRGIVLTPLLENFVDVCGSYSVSSFLLPAPI